MEASKIIELMKQCDAVAREAFPGTTAQDVGNKFMASVLFSKILDCSQSMDVMRGVEKFVPSKGTEIGY